ncbi:MAG TPA: hypothetical protein VHC67_18630 [Gaiellaceae bacterium]|jgi:hypothetical protein|nr:hypothetical protein [Gaiellaceae bacterium]
MDVELDPPQPEEVARAIAAELALPEAGAPDPWWRAGIDEALQE